MHISFSMVACKHSIDFIELELVSSFLKIAAIRFAFVNANADLKNRANIWTILRYLEDY